MERSVCLGCVLRSRGTEDIHASVEPQKLLCALGEMGACEVQTNDLLAVTERLETGSAGVQRHCGICRASRTHICLYVSFLKCGSDPTFRRAGAWDAQTHTFIALTLPPVVRLCKHGIVPGVFKSKSSYVWRWHPGKCDSVFLCSWLELLQKKDLMAPLNTKLH